jgi:hypothetical protein
MASAPASEREHAVSRSHMLDALGALEDNACNFQAGNERQLGLDLVSSFDHQDVGKIYARGSRLYADLSGSDTRAFNLCNFQSANTTERATEQCAHA